MQFIRAIMQPTNMCDLPREFEGEAKLVAGHFQPALHRVLRRDAVESGVNLDSREVTSIELEPLRRRKIVGIKAPAPFFIAPRAMRQDGFFAGQRDSSYCEPQYPLRRAGEAKCYSG